MARPAPQVLLTQDSRDRNQSDVHHEITTGEGCWIVMYQNQPFNYTKTTQARLGVTKKYERMAFANRAHAYNLARRLNDLFDTEEFTVWEFGSDDN